MTTNPIELVKRFHDICRRVIKAQPEHPDNYLLQHASAYSKVGLEMDDLHYIDAQILYIRVNLKSWRGDTARSLKGDLKKLEGDINAYHK